MATPQHEWGFGEITRKFERQSRPGRAGRPVEESRRRWMRLPARRTVHVGAWLAVIAVLLIGLVTIRVGLLYKNIEFNELIKEKNSLRAENDQLSSEVSTLDSPQRIEQIATGQLGMVPSGQVQYVYIRPESGHAGQAGQQYAQLDIPVKSP